MHVYFRIAGIQNGNYPYPTGIKIGDMVDLLHEKNNKYDNNAISIFYKNVKLGYIPKASNKNMKPCIKDSMQGFTPVECNLQEFIISKKIQYALVTWFQEPREGFSHSIELTLPQIPPYTFPVYSTQYRHYNKEGKHIFSDYIPFTERKEKGLYMSITSFLSHFEHKYTLKDNLDRLRNYQSTRTEQHVLDAQAKYGTLIHEFIEYTNTGKSKTADKIKVIIKDLTFKHAEHTVYDDDLMLAGTYDTRFDDIIFDWKSGKYPNPKHKYQLSFYCHNEGVNEGRIVYFGAQNKQGYTQVAMYQDQIHLGYDFISRLDK